MMVMLLIMLISGDEDRVMISVHLNNANVRCSVMFNVLKYGLF